MPSTTEVWAGAFGIEYTDRNTMTCEEMDAMYLERYGISRTQMNLNFLSDLQRNVKILEVGCNIGMELLFLQKMGFTNLSGIDIQPYAVEEAKNRGLNVIQGSASSLPFEDNEFDMVFTSGVLIHIPPEGLPKVMDEIYRCARKYIWGMEYHSPELSAIPYRGETGLLWKGDYSRMFLARFPNLFTTREQVYNYKTDSNKDVMYLLVKGQDDWTH